MKASGLLRWLLVLVLGYLVVTGGYGVVVGRDIAKAKNNPFAAVGATLVGRDAVERLAIAQMNVPAWATTSPAFWIALRLTE